VFVVRVNARVRTRTHNSFEHVLSQSNKSVQTGDFQSLLAEVAEHELVVQRGAQRRGLHMERNHLIVRRVLRERTILQQPAARKRHRQEAIAPVRLLNGLLCDEAVSALLIELSQVDVFADDFTAMFLGKSKMEDAAGLAKKVLSSSRVRSLLL